ncbi:uncharacterized protein N7483_000824 [Penicillium malachiteum]|uniref:uncharacterized protein n=1 Tax=Penicillium malachiteum TaxID=1324776 RepID=UPI0025492BB1|nr:uncharacterized protein N7483_000824 [Penicillium malachiteum]KAJ5735699.1 hypothetical protein N7483_000824 [Penicillium malachiteum]
MTTLHSFVNAIYGLFPGWYLNRSDGRVDSPLQSVQEWDSRLQKGGFRPLEFVANDFDGIAARTSLMVAQLPAPPHNTESIHCVLYSGSRLQKWADQITSRHGATDVPIKVVSAASPLPNFSSEDETEAVALVYRRDCLPQLTGQQSNSEASACIGALWITSKSFCPVRTKSLSSLRRYFDLSVRSHVVNLQLECDTYAVKDTVPYQVIQALTQTSWVENSDHPIETSYVYHNGNLMIPRFVNDKDHHHSVPLCNETNSQQDVEDHDGSYSTTCQSTDTLPSKTNEPVLTLTSRGSYLIFGQLETITLGICHYLNARGVSQIVIVLTEPVSMHSRDSFEGDLFVQGIQSHVEVLSGPLAIEACSDIQTVLAKYQPIKGCFYIGEVENQHLEDLSRNSSLEFIVEVKDKRSILSNQILPESPFASLQHSPHPQRHVVYLPFSKGEAGTDALDLSLVTQYGLRMTLGTTLSLGSATIRGQQTPTVVAVCNLNEIFYQNQVTESNRALLSHIMAQPSADTSSHSMEEARLTSSSPQPKMTNLNIKDASTPEEARQITTKLVKEIICTFVVTTGELPEHGKGIEELGLDSFIVFRLRNWIFGTFKADLGAPEIAESPSIYALVTKVLQRSPLGDWKQREGQKHDDQSESKGTQSTFEEPQKQPLPSLNDTLETYLNAVKPFCTTQELAITQFEIAKFQGTCSLGERLQQRLKLLADDPTVENWLSHLYAKRRFLASRNSLVAFQSYFGTHPSGPNPRPCQAARAALLAVTTSNFKRRLESGTLDTQRLSGRVVDSTLYYWQFNACREPHHGQDIIQKYSGKEYEYVVVFCKGNAFKVPLVADDGNYFSAMALQSEFQAILDLPLPTCELSILTADGRERWAKVCSKLLSHRAPWIQCTD